MRNLLEGKQSERPPAYMESLTPKLYYGLQIDPSMKEANEALAAIRSAS